VQYLGVETIVGKMSPGNPGLKSARYEYVSYTEMAESSDRCPFSFRHDDEIFGFHDIKEYVDQLKEPIT